MPRVRGVRQKQTGSLGLANASYYMNAQLNHFAVHQKLTQDCKSTIPQLKKKMKNLASSLTYFLKDFFFFFLCQPQKFLHYCKGTYVYFCLLCIYVLFSAFQFLLELNFIAIFFYMTSQLSPNLCRNPFYGFMFILNNYGNQKFIEIF